MNRSYIKILTTITYLFLFFLNCFLYFFFGSYFNMIFIFAMILVPVVSCLFAYFLSKRIQISVSGTSFVENRRDSFVFHIKITNPSILFANNCVLYITVENSLFHEKTTHTVNHYINPLHTDTITYPVTSDHCGIVRISVSKVQVFDFINIFSFHKDFNISCEIPVFPDFNIVTEEFEMDFSEGFNELDESATKGADSSEISDIREYIPGDKLQNIHWKLSAKKDLLMVKEHVSLTSSQLVFYVELADSPLLDDILDYAFGIGTFLCHNNIPFTFMWFCSLKQDVSLFRISNTDNLHDAVLQMLYESPITDYQSVNTLVAAMSGCKNFITIGTDYVLEQKAKTNE